MVSHPQFWSLIVPQRMVRVKFLYANDLRFRSIAAVCPRSGTDRATVGADWVATVAQPVLRLWGFAASLRFNLGLGQTGVLGLTQLRFAFRFDLDRCVLDRLCLD